MRTDYYKSVLATPVDYGRACIIRKYMAKKYSTLLVVDKENIVNPSPIYKIANHDQILGAAANGYDPLLITQPYQEGINHVLACKRDLAEALEGTVLEGKEDLILRMSLDTVDPAQGVDATDIK